MKVDTEVASTTILFFFLAVNSIFFDKMIMLKFVGIGKTFCSFEVGFALLTDIAGISVGVVTDLHAGYIRRQSRLLRYF